MMPRVVQCFLLVLGLTTTPFQIQAETQVYFSPNGGATAAVVREINAAKTEILVQAYSFTSAPIAKALAEAHKRGVKETAILDKSNETAKYSAATFLLNAGVPVWIDYRPAIAHSKVMVIDGKTVITGSFNFTKAAEEKNAENLLVIQDKALAVKYTANFETRKALFRLYFKSRGEVAVTCKIKSIHSAEWILRDQMLPDLD
jgi:phosphatidylserine/phosphatidylglycerophosphate/cardiolipin synthase-like enzyme